MSPSVGKTKNQIGKETQAQLSHTSKSVRYEHFNYLGLAVRKVGPKQHANRVDIYL